MGVMAVMVSRRKMGWSWRILHLGFLACWSWMFCSAASIILLLTICTLKGMWGVTGGLSSCTAFLLFWQWTIVKSWSFSLNLLVISPNFSVISIFPVSVIVWLRREHLTWIRPLNRSPAFPRRQRRRREHHMFSCQWLLIRDGNGIYVNVDCWPKVKMVNIMSWTFKFSKILQNIYSRCFQDWDLFQLFNL